MDDDDEGDEGGGEGLLFFCFVLFFFFGRCLQLERPVQQKREEKCGLITVRAALPLLTISIHLQYLTVLSEDCRCDGLVAWRGAGAGRPPGGRILSRFSVSGARWRHAQSLYVLKYVLKQGAAVPANLHTTAIQLAWNRYMKMLARD